MFHIKEEMEAVYAEQHKFHHSHHHHLKKPTVEIPPRKLLLSTRKQQEPTSPESPTMYKYWNKNPKIVEHAPEEETILSPNKDKDYCYDSDTDDPYATDQFRMYEFKIRRCTRSRSHDWTDCPFAHPGEKARRRDPRRYNYSGEVCPEFRRGVGCSRGEDCEFAHGVFECWLHPSRYRTEACKDGKNCKRKVCFFAHSPRQLRVLPPENLSGGDSASSLSPVLSNKSRCCLFCHSVSGSPTSTLLGLSHLSRSPSASPPLSPANRAAIARLRNNHGAMSYKDMLDELRSSLESSSLSEGVSSPIYSPVVTSAGLNSTKVNNNHNLVWLDVDFKDFQHKNHLQFALSPSTPSYPNESVSADLFGDDSTPRGRGSGCEKMVDEVSADPDLGWVNDLLM